jgi:hypothetical protein
MGTTLFAYSEDRRYYYVDNQNEGNSPLEIYSEDMLKKKQPSTVFFSYILYIDLILRNVMHNTYIHT